MPIYESLCLKCDTRHTYVAKSDDMYNTPACCGTSTEKRIFTAPRATFDIQPWDSYVSPATGLYVTSKAQRRADMAQSKTRPCEGIAQERKMAAEARAENQRQLDNKADVAVEKAWAQLPEKKKNILRNGL